MTLVARPDGNVLKYSWSSYSMSERLYLRCQMLNMGQTGWKYWNFTKSETRLRHVSFCEYWRLRTFARPWKIWDSIFQLLQPWLLWQKMCFTAFLLKFEILDKEYQNVEESFLVEVAQYIWSRNTLWGSRAAKEWKCDGPWVISENIGEGYL